MNTTETTELTRLLTERAEELHVEPDLDGVVQAPAPAATGGGGSGGRRAYLVAATAAVVVIGIGGALAGVPTAGQSSGGSTPIFQIDAAFAEPAAAGEVIVWLDPGASAADVDAVELRLAQSTDVERAIYVDRAATYDEFRNYYADQPEILELVTPEDLPTSFRVQASMPTAIVELLADLEAVDLVQGFTE